MVSFNDFYRIIKFENKLYRLRTDGSPFPLSDKIKLDDGYCGCKACDTCDGKDFTCISKMSETYAEHAANLYTEDDMPLKEGLMFKIQHSTVKYNDGEQFMIDIIVGLLCDINDYCEKRK